MGFSKHITGSLLHKYSLLHYLYNLIQLKDIRKVTSKDKQGTNKSEEDIAARFHDSTMQHAAQNVTQLFLFLVILGCSLHLALNKDLPINWGFQERNSKYLPKSKDYSLPWGFYEKSKEAHEVHDIPMTLYGKQKKKPMGKRRIVSVRRSLLDYLNDLLQKRRT